MSGPSIMKTVCCGHKFEHFINSPFRSRLEFSQECTNCGKLFSEDEVKLVYEDEIEDIIKEEKTHEC